MRSTFSQSSNTLDSSHYVCVSSPCLLRFGLQLVMRWFQYSIADFEETLNPENGGFVVMERREKEDTVCAA